MTPRRRLLATGSLALAAAALTGCEKPAPIVTIVNSGQSVYAEANTYCFEDQSLQEGNCAVRHVGTTELPVVAGQPVGVDVGKQLVEDGWILELSDPAAQGEQAQPQRSELQDGHYFTFTAPALPQDSTLLLTVRSIGEGDVPNGEWSFTLVPR